MSTTKSQHNKRVRAFRRGSGIALESGAIDAGAGLIAGISIMTAGVEALGHGIFDADGDYHEVFSDAKTLETALSCIDGIGEPLKAYMNHIDDVEGIVGVFDNFRIDGDHLRADFRVADGIDDGLRSRIFWMAETISKQFGISVVGMCEFDQEGEIYLLRFSEINSADFVGAPALNPGLFSKKPQNHKQKTKMSSDLTKQIEALTKRFAALEKENASLKVRLSKSEKKLAEIDVTIDTETDEVTVDSDDEGVDVVDETAEGEVSEESLEDETDNTELEEESETADDTGKKLSRIIDSKINKKFGAFAKALGIKRGVKMSAQPDSGKASQSGKTYAAEMSAKIASGKRFHVALSEVESESPSLVQAECKRLGVPSSAYLNK